MAVSAIRVLTTEEAHTWSALQTFTGNVLIQPSTDSTTAVQVLDADGGTPVFNVDTTNERVGVGTATPGTLLELMGSDAFVTLRDTDSSNANNGRQTRLIFEGQKADTSVSTLGWIDFAHFGSGDDDKGVLRFYLNDGDDGTSPTLVQTAIATDVSFHGVGVRIDNNKYLRAQDVGGSYRNLIGVDANDNVTIGASAYDDIRFDVGSLADAVTIQDTTGNVVIGDTTAVCKLHVVESDANTDAAAVVLRIDHALTAGETALADLGATMVWGLQDGGGTVNEVGSIQVFQSDPSAGAQDTTMEFGIADGGSLGGKMWMGKTGVGLGILTPTKQLHLNGSGNNIAIRVDNYSATNGVQAALEFRKSGTDTIETLAVTADTEDLGQFTAFGVDSGNTAFRSAGRILFEQDGAAGAANVPGMIKIQVATNAAGVASGITVRSDKKTGFNQDNPASTVHVNGDSQFGDGTNKTAINATGDLTFAGSAGFYPRTLSQDGEPAAGVGATQIDSGELIVWIDTNDSNRRRLVYNHGGTVVSIEMAA